MSSPTSRTLQECKRRGWIAGVVEKYNSFSRKRHDLFEFIDIVAMTGKGILGIQATSDTNHSARVKKLIRTHNFYHWKRNGGKVAVWSWGKRFHRNKDGSKSKAKRWVLREQEM